MTAIEDPIEFELVVRTNTDHEWRFRRKDAAGNPLIPSVVKAEIRSLATGALWHTLTCTIDEDGWISITLPNVAVDESVWLTRHEGEWDLLVTYEGRQYRWVEGAVTVDIGVTA